MDQIVVDAVFDVRRRVGNAEEPLVIGLVLGEEQFGMPSQTSQRGP